MYNRNEDRHETPRSFQSGAQKRKIAAEKEKNFEQVLSKTPKINSFFSCKSPGAVNIEQPTTPANSSISEFDKTEVKIDTDAQLKNILENPNFMTDIGLWIEPFTDDVIEFWIEKGSNELQNCDEKVFSTFSTTQISVDGTESTRKCTTSLFYRTNQNKEMVNRFWLCFSPSTGKIYCFLCKLLSTPPHVAIGKEGYCDWKHASERLSQHETSKSHLNSVIAFSTRSNEMTCINRKLKEQVSFYLKI